MIEGSLVDYQKGKYIPQVVMVMSIALADYKKYHFFTVINFGAIYDNDNNQRVEFSAMIQDENQNEGFITGLVNLSPNSDCPIGDNVVFHEEDAPVD